MSRPHSPQAGRVWAALVGGPVAVELVAHFTGHTEWTLSPHARRWFQCHTAPGRALVTIGTGAGATWLAHHLITIPPPPEES